MANEFRDIGRDIRDAVRDAIDSGDFSQLNSRINNSVGDAIREVNERLNERKNDVWSQTRKEDTFPQWGPSWPPRPPQQPQPSQTSQPRRTPQPSGFPVPSGRQEPALFRTRVPGSVSGILYTVFGSIFLGAFGITAAVLMIVFMATGFAKLPLVLLGGIFGSLALGSGIMLGIGQKLYRKAKRFKEYIKILAGKTHFAIADLARRIGKKEKFVLRELKRMISDGWFLQGHIDDEQKTLLVTDEVYRHYQELQARNAARIEAEARQAEESEEETLFRETVEQGARYLSAIRSANDAIAGEVVSEKLYRLEDIVGKIYEQVKQNPSQIGELRRFLDYYMPMTLKLVETYQKLDAQPMAGANIRKAKEEIEKTLDTINLAFENLFDSLFEHTAVDITSDITVLKNMLRQEGLTGGDFQ